MVIKIVLQFDWVNQASYGTIEMTIHAERALFDKLFPTGNSLVKKCMLMTSHERKYHCLHTCEGLSSLLLSECFIPSKMIHV